MTTLIRLALGSFVAVFLFWLALSSSESASLVLLDSTYLITTFMSSPMSLTVLLSRPSLCTRGSNLQFLSKTITAVWVVIVSEECIIFDAPRAQLRVDSPSFWTQCSKSTIVLVLLQVPWKFLINFSLRSVHEVKEFSGRFLNHMRVGPSNIIVT